MDTSSALPDTAPKKFVFVLMPFADAFRDIYEVGIKPACRDAGAYCERVDEQIFHESILEQIYNQISKADLIVADMTGRNPNVFYEVGYAHALNKKTVLLTSNSDDIPFDLQHYPHVVYNSSITDLKSELERRVSWYLNQDDTEVYNAVSYLEYYINGQQLAEGRAILIERAATQIETVIGVSIYNSSQRMLNLTRMRVSIKYPHKRAFYLTTRTRNGRPPTIAGDTAVLWQEIEANMLPETWEAFDLILFSDIPHEVGTVPIKFGVTTAVSSLEIGVELVFSA